MPVDSELFHGRALCGGYIADIADQVLGLAAMSVLEDGYFFGTTNMAISYLSPVTGGELRVEVVSLEMCKATTKSGSRGRMMKSKSGQCRCGLVRFEVGVEPLITMACHCTGCQRMTSSAYSLSELYPLDAFKVIEGAPVTGGLQAETKHYFCPDCKSWLFTRPEGVGNFVNVRATMMENARSFVPFLEAYTDEMLPWATTGATRSFKKFPPAEEFPDLITAYAQR